MHSFLVIGTNKDGVDKEIIRLAKKLKAPPFEFELSKVGHAKSLNKFARLKVTRPTTILIREIDRATKEASNAFLKNLEEPQGNIYYILTARHEHNILPTILSRCQIIRVNVKMQVLQVSSAREFIKMSISEKLSHVTLIKGRDEAIEFVENLILMAHSYLHAKNLKNHRKVADFIENSQTTLSALRANGNVSLQLANFVLAVD